MKKLLYIILIFLSPALFGANYYVSSSTGADGNPGTQASPWASLSKVESTSFSAGDVIHFKAGDTFRGDMEKYSMNGTSSAYIQFTSYGSGADPLILQSINLAGSGNWSVYSGNIWRSGVLASSGDNDDIANLIFNNDASCGIKCFTYAEVNIQGEWYWNASENRVYIYSAANPGSYYTNIEAAGAYSALGTFFFHNCSYVQIDNLDFRYAGNGAIWMENCRYFVLEHCNYAWIGGWYYYTDGVLGPYRLGNAIQMWCYASSTTYVDHIIIRYNTITQCYDAGISPQGYGTYSQTDISIYYNVISYCYYTYEVFTKPGCTLTNVHFWNNTCLYSGYQWSANQRPDNTHQEHIRNGQAGGTTTNCTIKNNIFYVSYNCAYEFQESFSGWTVDYNLLYVTEVGEYQYVGYANLGTWRTATSQDAHSIQANPAFVTPITDLHLRSDSQAINAGTSVGLTSDIEGNPIEGLPDIGAYEYVSSSTPVTGNGYVKHNGNFVKVNGNFVKY